MVVYHDNDTLPQIMTLFIRKQVQNTSRAWNKYEGRVSKSVFKVLGGLLAFGIKTPKLGFLTLPTVSNVICGCPIQI